MNKTEIRNKNILELNGLLKDLRLQLESFGTDVLQGKEKNVKKGRFIRKDIARLMTYIKVKESEIKANG